MNVRSGPRAAACRLDRQLPEHFLRKHVFQRSASAVRRSLPRSGPRGEPRSVSCAVVRAAWWEGNAWIAATRHDTQILQHGPPGTSAGPRGALHVAVPPEREQHPLAKAVVLLIAHFYDPRLRPKPIPARPWPRTHGKQYGPPPPSRARRARTPGTPERLRP
jgi:hypothetical protein